MSDTRVIDSNGRDYKSMVAAAVAFIRDPSLTFERSTLSMAGERRTEITDEVQKWAERQS